jgi:hypothetical protein
MSQMEINFESLPTPRASAYVPLVVCCGVGVDSTAMLVGYKQRGIKPDLIIFADVGAERRSTYDFFKVLNEWVKKTWGMEIVVVRYKCKDFKHWPAYHTIEENVLTNCALPSIAYGFHKCSAKWKIAPICAYIEAWAPALVIWAAGGKVRKAIGFEFSPHELKRSKRCSTFAVQEEERSQYDIEFPLQEWQWNRERCLAECAKEGLFPDKSSCYFCTAMKPVEVDALPVHSLKRIVIIEARSRQRHLDYAEERGWPAGPGKPMTEGIWRKRVKGMRGATPKPGSMTEYIREKGLLPGEEIDRLIAATPTRPLTQADFNVLGVSNWQDWLTKLCGN